MISTSIHEQCIDRLQGNFLKGQRVMYITVLYNPLILVIRCVIVYRE